MPFIKRVKPKHECRPPSPFRKRFDVGSTWECRQCSQRWEAVQARMFPRWVKT